MSHNRARLAFRVGQTIQHATTIAQFQHQRHVATHFGHLKQLDDIGMIALTQNHGLGFQILRTLGLAIVQLDRHARVLLRLGEFLELSVLDLRVFSGAQILARHFILFAEFGIFGDQIVVETSGAGVSPLSGDWFVSHGGLCTVDVEIHVDTVNTDSIKESPKVVWEFVVKVAANFEPSSV